MAEKENLLKSCGGNDIRQIYIKSGLRKDDFLKTYNIPRRTFEDWLSGKRAIKQYVLDLLDFKVDYDLLHR